MTRTGLLRGLMLALWLQGLLAAFVTVDWLRLAGLLVLSVYLILAWPTSNKLNRLVALLVGGIAIIFAGWEGRWETLVDGFAYSLVFTAFLPTLGLIRATLNTGPEVVQTRQSFAAMAADRRGSALLVGSNVLGSVLTLGVLPLLAPLLPVDATVETRRHAAQSILRGLALSISWSPFTVGMAIALTFWPAVSLWQVLLLGLPIAVLGILLSISLSWRRSGGLKGVVTALAAFKPLVFPLGGAMLAVVVLASVSTLGTIQTIVLVMPVLCLLWIMGKSPGELRRVARTTYQGLDRLGGELLLFGAAVTLGRVLQESPAVEAFFSSTSLLALPTATVMAVIMGLGVALALVGMHSVVLGSCLIVLLLPLNDRLHDLIAVHILLFGWSCGALLSLSALSIVVASSLFDVPIPRLIIGQNILYMGLFGTLVWLVLYALNTVMLPGAAI